MLNGRKNIGEKHGRKDARSQAEKHRSSADDKEITEVSVSIFLKCSVKTQKLKKKFIPFFLKFVKIRDFLKFLKFVEWEFSKYGDRRQRLHRKETNEQ